ncbi:MAG: hypothetical protein AAB413_01165 [Patescibacteria group bacterium]
MGNTRRRLQSLFPASGLVVFTACAGMPPGTSPLTDQEREEVDAVIDELEVEMPMVEGLLGTADPLFNLEGQPTADNHLLIVGVGEVLLDIEGMVEADRVVVRQFEEQPQGIEAVARGSRTQSTQADDYIILTLSSEGELVLTPSLLMHEGTHYFFGAHDSTFLDSHDPSMSTQESLVLALEYRDAPYTVAHLYNVAETAYDVGARLEEETRELAQMETFTGSDTAALHNRQQRFDYLSGFLRLGQEGWAQQLAQILWSSQASTLERFGVTQEELETTLRASDGLYESHREAAHEALEFWQETFPEFSEEAGRERRREFGR